jgi:hypothetical protein
VRGHAYNPFATEGAASTVYDIVSTPADIHGKRFIYISPDNFGYAAFDLGGSSMLVGLDNSGALGELVLGFATADLGVALLYSIGKTWTSEEVSGGVPGVSSYNITTSTRITRPGDNIGLNFSLPLGLYVNLGWYTYSQSYSTEVEGTGPNIPSGEISLDYSEIGGIVGFLGNAGNLAFNAYLSALRTGGTATNTVTGKKGDKAVDPNTYSRLGIGMNIGYAALSNQTTRVIVGSNNFISMRFYDEVKDGPEPYDKSGSVINVTLQPNLLGEIAFAEKWFAFVGATQSINLRAGGGASLRNEDASQLEIWQTQTRTVFAGMRYNNDNWALEAIVSDDPFQALGGSNILTQLGGFIYF